jgi:hypothetical protein
MPYLKSFGGVKEHTIEIQNSFVNVIGQREIVSELYATLSAKPKLSM